MRSRAKARARSKRKNWETAGISFPVQDFRVYTSCDLVTPPKPIWKICNQRGAP